MLTSTNQHISKHIKKYTPKVLVGFIVLIGLICVYLLSILFPKYFGQQVGVGQYIMLFYATIIFLYIIFALWCIRNWGRFTNLDGKVKRGVLIAKRSLSPADQQFLKNLSFTVKDSNWFIHKKDDQIIISEERDFWKRLFTINRFNSVNRWPYIGYINLNKFEGKIEFRTPFSALLDIIIVLFIWLIISIGPFMVFDGLKRIPLECITFLGLVWGLFIIRILINHSRECNSLIGILNKARIDDIK